MIVFSLKLHHTAGAFSSVSDPVREDRKLLCLRIQNRKQEASLDSTLVKSFRLFLLQPCLLNKDKKLAVSKKFSE